MYSKYVENVKKLNVNGIILAGGEGKRLRPYTKIVPKQLLPLKGLEERLFENETKNIHLEGFAILDKQIYDMLFSGVQKVIISAGYLGDKIVERYDQDRFRKIRNKTVVYKEEEPLDTGGAIKRIIEEFKLKGPLVVSNADVVSDINILQMIFECRQGGYLGYMYSVRPRLPWGVLKIDESASGLRKPIIGFREKPKIENWVNGGFYFFEDTQKLYSEYLENKGKKFSLEKDVFPKMASDRQLGMYKEEDWIFWRPVDTKKDWDEVREFYKTLEYRSWGYEKTINEKPLIKELFIKKHFETENRDFNEEIIVEKGELKVKFDGIELEVKKRLLERNHRFVGGPAKIISRIL